MGNINEQEKKIPLGKRLRQITSQVQTNKEALALEEILLNAANKGDNQVSFDDLRTVVPLMIQSGTLQKWIEENELLIQGAVNSNNAKWQFTISW